MTTTDELLVRLVNRENEAVEARQRQSSAEDALVAAQHCIQLLSSGDGTPSASAGVIDARTLGKPKCFTGQTAFARAAHPRMKEVFDLATRKGPDPVVNSDMTAGVAVTEHTAVLHSRDDAQRSSSAEVWRKLLWEYERGVGIRFGTMLQSLLKRRFGEHDETDLARRLSSSSVTSSSMSSSPAISSAMS